MKLREFLKITGKSQRKFAWEIKIPQPTFNKYCSGKRRPVAKNILKISKATKGAVTANDFYDE